MTTTHEFTPAMLGHINRQIYCHGCQRMGEMTPCWVDAMGRYVYQCQRCSRQIAIYYMRETNQWRNEPSAAKLSKTS